ncbi:MAG: response regulator [Lachnospiraceae bacterium]|nr:response regulator [Lachnospiraceae bacterium]
MKKGTGRLKNFIGFLRSDEVTIDAKGLYLMIIYSVVINIGYAIGFIIKPSGSPACLCIAIGSIVFFLLTAYLLNRFDELQLFKYIVVLAINFIMFPTMFYMTGNLLNGALLFMPLGLVFTFFLIKEKWSKYIFAVEIVWYSVILILPMIDYEKYSRYGKVIPHDIGIPISFVAAAFAPIFIFIYQTVNYERTKRKLNESRHIIETARYNKSRFLANVTHEIRTPMNAIIGMNELILREDLDPESRELAENIKISSNQLLKIINNVLEFSKLDSNRMELYPTKYDFRTLMTEIIEAVSNEYASENTEFYAKIDPNIPRTLFGDSIRIKQIFMYLLFSSVHMLPHSRMSMEVNGEVDINTNTVMLSCTIAESGFGLSEVEIEAMLSAYTKYDSRQKSDYKGMGLELSICKEILELMGGSLSIKSVEGVGMSVHFELINYIIEDNPIVRISTTKDYSILIYTKNAEDQDVWIDILGQFQLYPNFVTGPNAFRQAIENRRYTHIFIDDMFYPMLKDTIRSAQINDEVYVLTEAGSIFSDFDNCKILRRPMTCLCVADALNNVWDSSDYKVAQKKEAVTYPEGKIIIVDDSIVNLRVLEGMLQTFSVNTTKCKSGAEALSVLEREEFDLIILDQRMPEMDGIELLHLIRKLDNANAMVPILCATADFGPEVSRMLLNEGFQDYLAKPVRRFYLERMLRKYMPPELAVNIVVDDIPEEKQKKPEESAAKEAPAKDPKDIDFESGLRNVGGSTDAFASVVNAYYNEGIKKLELVPELLAAKNIDNYVVEVHALKSSSAAIGAEAMSTLFRELEFAGKASNIEFIESHSGNVFETFKGVLDVVKNYLTTNGLFESETGQPEPEGDIVELDISLIDELIDHLSKFNIKATEDKINECCGINYGSDINKSIREIKNQLDVFDYHKAKELLTDLKRRRNESGL